MMQPIRVLHWGLGAMGGVMVRLMLEKSGLKIVAAVDGRTDFIGNRGQDAFGSQVEYVDRGIRKRALCNIGRQDVVIDGIVPEDQGIIVLGGSSDHLVLDVEEAEQEVRLGDEIGFYPTYSSLLAATTSPYMQKVILKD